MLNFRKDFPEAKEVLLDVNYRSQECIVKAAGCLIGHNKVRYPKAIRPIREAMAPVCIHDLKNIKEESDFIVGSIREKLKQGIPPEEMVVLYRTSVQPRQLLEKMMEYNLPFCLKEGLPDIYQHWIAANLIAYIHIAQGSRERRDFLAVMNRPNRYISREALFSADISFEACGNITGKRTGWWRGLTNSGMMRR